MENTPLLSGKIEPREYQINLFREAIGENTLIVLPTGLGKTIIAAMVAEHILKETGDKVLFLAPTKPLVSQHYDTLKNLLSVDERKISMFTGEVDNEDRLERWVTSRVVVSTPQVVVNDLRKGIFDISKFGLIVFDEAHRASGNYSYVQIAKAFFEVRKRLVLAITASPGGDKEKFEGITETLGIENVRIKSEEDDDVRKYVNEVKLKVVNLQLPEHIKTVLPELKSVYNEIVSKLRNKGFFPERQLSRKILAAKIPELISRAKSGENSLFGLIPYVSAAIRVDYAIEYLETQGVEISYDYLLEILNSEERTLQRTSSILKKIGIFQSVMEKLESLRDADEDNPKMREILRLCESTIRENPKSKIIVFTHFRKTSEMLNGYLTKKSPLIKSIRFVGQASRNEDIGLSQKEQDKILQGFRGSEYNVLVATSVAEEGLDIPSTDLVVFYEPVPSEIRTIQRRGRTGRKHAGEVYILMYEGTRDNGYYFSSIRKEKSMKRNIGKFQSAASKKEIKKEVRKTGPVSLDDFS